MKRIRPSNPLKKQLLDQALYEAILPAYRTLSRYGSRYPKGSRYWRRRRERALQRIQRLYALQRRHRASEVLIEEMVSVIQDLNSRVKALDRKRAHLGMERSEINEDAEERRDETLLARIATLEAEREEMEVRIAVLVEENEQLQARVKEIEKQRRRGKRAPSAVSAAWDWKLNPLEERILLLVGETGLGRPWRIAAHLAREEEGGYRQGSVRNALNRLQELKLVKEVLEHGRPRRWSGPRGGGRSKLLLLSDLGQAWYESQTGQEAVESELIWAQREHQGVVHGVAILEVADALQARGYEVDLSPKPIFQDPGQRWGRRARPDLVARKGDRWWPVEVQRKVSDKPHYREKWAKTLRLTGRLMLVLFSEDKLAQQRRLLLSWSRRRDWPDGEVLLASLEAMTSDPADWTFQSLD